MQRVLLVGKNSFIGGNFIALEGPTLSLHAVSHSEIESVDFRKYDCVVNTAYQWSYFNTAYSEERDFSLQVARKVAAHGAHGAHFVMMSSRKVYGTEDPVSGSRDGPSQCRGLLWTQQYNYGRQST